MFGSYMNQIKAIEHEDFQINGKVVRVFLGEYYHFQDPMVGHGGSSLTYPSNADFVELRHLRNHGSGKHSIEECGIDLQTVKWYEDYYRENDCNIPHEGSLNDNAKHHFSVIDKMLFPIKTLDNVVPPVLHIYLGITLRLFNLLEAEVIKLDGGKTDEEKKKRADLADQLSEKEELMNDLQSEIRIWLNSQRIIELENLMSRFQATLSGNSDENEAIAEATYVRSKIDRKKIPSVNR